MDHGRWHFEQRSTEQSLEAVPDLDLLETGELLATMNAEDHRIAPAVREALPAIARVVDVTVDALRNGHRLVYAGAGTSGRLAVLDAAELWPTFGVPAGTVEVAMAGGQEAVGRSLEGVEDDGAAGASRLRSLGVGPGDVVLGISASGRTPYVVAAMEYARTAGAITTALVCNPGSVMEQCADVTICVDVGPEVLAGSTRLKSGTAQKMVLNMISTATMVRLGKVYGRFMVDMTVSNEKLRRRAQRIVRAITAVGQEDAEDALVRAGGNVKVAVVIVQRGVSPDVARALLEAAGGNLRTVLEGVS